MNSSVIAFDTETFRFRPGLQAPPVVCLQWATPAGDSAVEITRDIRDAFAWVLEHDTIVSHHGPYDFLCLAEWYPEFRPAILSAFDDGRVWDTMIFERLIEIGLGLGRGNLGLDMVATKYGLPPPDKSTTATLDGVEYDVRTSFDLWYMQDEIPDPWHGYALYDGISTVGIQARQQAKWLVGAARGTGLLHRDDLATVCRTHFARTWTRGWGLRVNPGAVGDLERVVDGAIERLRGEAVRLGFLRPKLSGRGNARTQAKDPRTGQPLWVRDTKKIKAAVTAAFGGAPPVTQKNRRTGKGGGNISCSKDTLEDSGDTVLATWAEYGEMSTARNKDLKLLQENPIHTKYGLTNTLRPTSSGPNIANFRRNGFLIGTCPDCGYETTLDAKEAKDPPTCPNCS